MLNKLKRMQAAIDHKSYFIKNRRFGQLKPDEIVRHNCLHLAKLVAKIADVCEQEDHNLKPSHEHIIKEAIPDLVIYALQLANVYGIDLDKSYKQRLEFVLNKYKGFETPYHKKASKQRSRK